MDREKWMAGGDRRENSVMNERMDDERVEVTGEGW